MTLHDRDTDRAPHRRDAGDEFDVARGVPTDRVRWGPILAGTFTALTALAILATLGAAVGFSSYDRGEDDVRNFAMAGGAWGLLSTIIAFALGGWVAARAAAIRGRDNGMLNGALVAAVGIPLMLFLFGSAATAMSSAEVANGRDARAQGTAQQGTGLSDGAMTASARIGPPGRRSHRLGALTAMVLAVGASAAAGYVGARRDSDERRRDEHGRDAGARAAK